MRASRLFGLLASCMVAARVGGQLPANASAADSASAARSAWGRTVAAVRGEDYATALREVEQASLYWPTQEAYTWGLVRLSARARDTTRLFRALAAYADLGLGRNVRSDTTFAPFMGMPSFTALAARHAANRAPLVRSHVVAELPDSTLFPEGMDYDVRTGRYYVSSVRHRTVVEVSPQGEVLRELIPRHQAGIGAILGVRVDAPHGLVYATIAGLPQMEGYAPNDSLIAGLLRIRISDGSIEKRWDLPPSPNGHTLGDVVIGPRGDVFVTDSRDPVLYRLRPGADTLERFTHRLFRSPQGMAPTPDGRTLYLADYSHGLLRVDLATGDVTRLADAPHSTSLGCDGIAWYDGSIIAVQNGVAPARIVRFMLDASGRRITSADVLDRNVQVADEPTIGAMVGDEFVYVATSQWEKYDNNGQRLPATTLGRPVLLRVKVR